MCIYAVFDTNVLVSAMLTSHKDTATAKMIDAIVDLRIVPLFHQDILVEYYEVMSRKKFGFSTEDVESMIGIITSFGVPAERVLADEIVEDPKDLVFYEVALSKKDAYVVTGNIKDFPSKPIVVTPAEMLKILEETR